MRLFSAWGDTGPAGRGCEQRGKLTGKGPEINKDRRGLRVLIHLRKGRKSMQFYLFMRDTDVQFSFCISFMKFFKGIFPFHLNFQTCDTEFFSISSYFFFCHFIYFNLFIFDGKIIALRNFVLFCQTSTRISLRYTHVPSLANLSPISLPISSF